jgi:hypothetical protein
MKIGGNPHVRDFGLRRKASVNADETMDFLKQTVAIAPDLAAEEEEPEQNPRKRR